MRLIPVLIFLLSTFNCSAQDLSGKWTAIGMPNGFYTTPSKVVAELRQHGETTISGVIHYYYPGSYYEHYRLIGTINNRTGAVSITEDSLINFKMEPGAILYNGTFILQMEQSTTVRRMNGYWKPLAPGTPTISFVWHREVTEQRKDTATEQVKILKPERIDKISQVVEIDPSEADSIHVDVYDNGEIDGDTVTVSLNNKVVILRKRITDKPLSFSTTLHKNQPTVQIKMVAENLGTIPPNTAMMIITTKKNRYTVRLSSDLKSNGVVELFLKQ